MKKERVTLTSTRGASLAVSTGEPVRPSELAQRSGLKPAAVRYLLRREKARRNGDGTYTLIAGRRPSRAAERRRKAA